MVNTAIQSLAPMWNEELSIAWLAGAMAAITDSPDWAMTRRTELVQDVLRAARQYSVSPVYPGGTVRLACSFSQFDVLGGFVSIAGRVCDDALFVPLDLHRAVAVLGLLGRGIVARVRGRSGVRISAEHFEAVGVLLPLRGPLIDEMGEVTER